MSKENPIIAKIEQYLKQQDSYGNTLYLDNEYSILSQIKAIDISNNISSSTTKNKTVNVEMIKSEKTKAAVVIDSSDLFTDEPEWKKSENLQELYDKIHTCTNCILGDTRKNFVFGSGSPKSNIMIIGEAPGADEDEQGLPFVGRAGQLLTKIIESIGLKREDVYICNIIKCRPPGNRQPQTDEVEQCEPYLKKQIELIKPQFILALGLTAVDTLFKKKHKMADIRGSINNYHGIKLLVTYHPAALLRNPEWKKLVWEDMKSLKKMLEEYLKNK